MRFAILPLLSAILVANPVGADDPPKPKAANAYEFTGRTEASAVLEVRARVTGHLTKVAVREGATVKAGDLLVEIDGRAYAIDLTVAKAKLTVAEAQVKVATVEVARVKAAAEKGIVSTAEFEQAQARLDASRAEMEVAKAEMKRAELNLSWTKIVAPRAGRVSRVLLDEGNLVSSDTTTLMTVVSADQLYVVFEVDERSVAKLRRELQSTKDGKLAVTIGFSNEDGFPHAVALDSIGAEVDPKTATVRFRATLPNPKGEYLPGAFVRVRVTPQPAK